jgi:hypothetical protein
MDGKGKMTSFWSCRVTKMTSLKEKIKLKKPSLKWCCFMAKQEKPLLPPSPRVLSFIVESLPAKIEIWSTRSLRNLWQASLAFAGVCSIN